MNRQLNIEGMTCMNCVKTVQQLLVDIPEILTAEVQLEHPQAQINLKSDVSIQTINERLGKYTASYIDSTTPNNETSKEIEEVKLENYKPLIIVVAYILGISLLVQFPFERFDIMRWMNHFMGGFFIAFSFFKMLDIRSFASSFSMYDIISSKWPSYGLIYPFIELLLGIGYLIDFNSIILNTTVIIVLGLGTIGVVQSNLQKRKIQCACLGTVFNLPMSKVTIIENITMIIMALAALL